MKIIEISIKFYLTKWYFSLYFAAKWEKVVIGGIEFENWGLKSCSVEGMSIP